tara:strand:- start:71 stop:394 length:324 start_codon:yes stop_codon:yes gene_type:complete
LATLQHNITTILTKDLLTVGDNVNNAKYISFSNVGSSTAYLDLFLNKKENNYYLIKNRQIGVGQTLTLSKDNNIAFDNTSNGFSLRIQVDDGQGGPGVALVDVVITK